MSNFWGAVQNAGVFSVSDGGPGRNRTEPEGV